MFTGITKTQTESLWGEKGRTYSFEPYDCLILAQEIEEERNRITRTQTNDFESVSTKRATHISECQCVRELFFSVLLLFFLATQFGVWAVWQELKLKRKFGCYECKNIFFWKCKNCFSKVQIDRVKSFFLLCVCAGKRVRKICNWMNVNDHHQNNNEKKKQNRPLKM